MRGVIYSWPQNLIRLMSVDWVSVAVNRIERREYEKRSRFMFCTPRVHHDRNNHDVIVARTDGGRRTNICVTCFTFSGKIRVACAQGHGATGLICCHKHRNANMVNISTSAANTVPAAEIVVTEPKAKTNITLMNILPPLQFQRLQEIVSTKVFHKIVMFRDEEFGETILQENGFPVHVFPSGYTEPLCAACLYFSQVVRPAYRGVSEGFCYRHYDEKQKSGEDWPSEDVDAESLRVELSSPPKTKSFLALSPCQRTKIIDPSDIKQHPFRYMMKVKRILKIVTRLQLGQAPIRTALIAPNSCPYIHHSGELRQWDGILSTRICEACYSKKNVMRLTKGGLSRLCGRHTK